MPVDSLYDLKQVVERLRVGRVIYSSSDRADIARADRGRTKRLIPYFDHRTLTLAGNSCPLLRNSARLCSLCNCDVVRDRDGSFLCLKEVDECEEPDSLGRIDD